VEAKMYFVSVESSFDSAHSLRNYGGKCENLHGHRFKVVVKLKSETLNDAGLAYDFIILKKQLNDVLAKYDHHNLNDVPPYDHINPSSENLARTICDELLEGFPDNVKMHSVEVWESPESCAIYNPD
jgi:6-pyruvoyltetrahydropterin/6-carboxytetrahydropterin synthase